MDDKIALAEDNQFFNKTELKNNSKDIIDQIQILLDDLKNNFSDDAKFYETLRVIHGRFSKVELNLIELEKLKNAGI